mgnify:CR=1 FL=1
MTRPKLRYLPLAKETVKTLNPVIKPNIKAEIERLAYDPYKGKELLEELSGFRSLAIGKYRLIYRFEEPHRIDVCYVGHRRDIYERFREMLEGIK